MVGSLRPRCRRARSDRISHSRPHKKKGNSKPDLIRFSIPSFSVGTCRRRRGRYGTQWVTIGTVTIRITDHIGWTVGGCTAYGCPTHNAGVGVVDPSITTSPSAGGHSGRHATRSASSGGSDSAR